MLPLSNSPNAIQEPAKKKRRLRTSETPAPEDRPLSSAIIGVSTSSYDHHCPATTTPIDYFDSPEANHLFATKDDETTRQSVNAQIAVLMSANDGATGYLSILDGGEELDEDTLTDRFKHSIRQKCLVLTLALRLALEQMNGWTWTMCCEVAIKVATRMGVSITRNADTVKKWYRHFRSKRKFIVPTRHKHNLPPLLELNPDICSAIKKYACSNLNILTIELVAEYIHHTILPEMAWKEMVEQSSNNKPTLSQEETEKAILRRYGLTKLCPSTVYKWMKLLGFKYELQHKGYYVDGHEKPATVAYRKDFVSRYLTEEVQMFRWIQITKEESEKLEDEGKIAKNTGYVYNHPQTNLPWVEYHVDTCDEFQRRMNEEQAFGGWPSV